MKIFNLKTVKMLNTTWTPKLGHATREFLPYIAPSCLCIILLH